MSLELDFDNLKRRLESCARRSDGKRIIDLDLRRDVLRALVTHQVSPEMAAKKLGVAASTLWKWRRSKVKKAPFKKVAVTQYQASAAPSAFLKAPSGIEIHGLSISDIATLLREVVR